VFPLALCSTSYSRSDSIPKVECCRRGLHRPSIQSKITEADSTRDAQCCRLSISCYVVVGQNDSTCAMSTVGATLQMDPRCPGVRNRAPETQKAYCTARSTSTVLPFNERCQRANSHALTTSPLRACSAIAQLATRRLRGSISAQQ